MTRSIAMDVVLTRGTLDGIQPIEIIGILDRDGRCLALRVIDLWNGNPISWAMLPSTIAGFERIVEALGQAGQGR